MCSVFFREFNCSFEMSEMCDTTNIRLPHTQTFLLLLFLLQFSILALFALVIGRYFMLGRLSFGYRK